MSIKRAARTLQLMATGGEAVRSQALTSWAHPGGSPVSREEEPVMLQLGGGGAEWEGRGHFLCLVFSVLHLGSDSDSVTRGQKPLPAAPGRNF